MTSPSSSPAADFDVALRAGETTTTHALALFDRLPPVDLEFMLGPWRGAEFPTGHPIDGLLEAVNWYGKEFIDPDRVHPLVFLDGSDARYRIAPHPTLVDWMLRLPIPKVRSLQPLFAAFTLPLRTDDAKARLRMMEHRGQVSATMIYDHLPIHDVFKQVDEDTVLGLMDFKGHPQPFFFVLRRDT